MTSSLLLSPWSVEEEKKPYLRAPISGVAESQKYHVFRNIAMWGFETGGAVKMKVFVVNLVSLASWADNTVWHNFKWEPILIWIKKNT